MIQVGVHDTARTAIPRRKPRRKCASCHHERTIVAHGKCTSCYYRSRHLGAVGNQTIQPSLLMSGDVIPWRGKRLSVTWVGLQLCEIAPKVRIRAQELPDGPSLNLLFDADDYVPVEVAQ